MKIQKDEQVKNSINRLYRAIKSYEGVDNTSKEYTAVRGELISAFTACILVLEKEINFCRGVVTFTNREIYEAKRLRKDALHEELSTDANLMTAQLDFLKSRLNNVYDLADKLGVTSSLKVLKSEKEK